VKRALTLLAVAVWLASFALPTIDMGGRGVAPGFIAAYYAVWTAPTVGSMLSAGRIETADVPFALLMATYFPLLAFANVLVPLSLARRLDLGVLRIVTAVLATGVMLVPFRELWRVLDLALGERVRLDVGYYAWLLSFWLLVLVIDVGRRIDVRFARRASL
jgi:hypothetical protein